MKAVALVPPSVAMVSFEPLEDAAASWTAFYRGEYPRLARALFACTGDRDTACELAQEAMARAWCRWARVSRFESPAAWTYRVAMNLANSRWRRLLLSRRVGARQDTDETSTEPDIGVRLAVRQAVAALPRRQRTALVLRHFADLPVDEVARLMDCRPGTVTALTGKAIAKLRAGLAEYKGES